MLIKPVHKIAGTLRFKGDKSISHRVVLISLMNRGQIEAINLSDCQDVSSSIEAIKKLGVKVSATEDAIIFKNQQEFAATGDKIELFCGNSGTTARLLTGILCGRPGAYQLTGDESLSRRPMQRVIAPLSKMGAQISSDNNQNLPISIFGKNSLDPINFTNQLSSAQVKSAILLAALNAAGTTHISENLPSRDHTERLLKHTGVPINFSDTKASLTGPFSLSGNFSFRIPGDISSAAFFAVAAAMIPGSRLVLSDVLLNPGRIAFLRVLTRMGAAVTIEEKCQDWETSGDVIINGGSLRGTTIEESEIPGLIDELPALAVAMVFATGKSVVKGAGELRHKETDRISVLIEQFKKSGIRCIEHSDGFTISGSAQIFAMHQLDPGGDHRLAMALALLGLKSMNGIVLREADCIKISCPDFFSMLDSVRQ